jgi:hypothetical protein
VSQDSNVNDLAARVAQEFNAVRAEQGTRTYVQSTAPTADGPYLWWDTSGGDLTLWIEDGS